MDNKSNTGKNLHTYKVLSVLYAIVGVLLIIGLCIFIFIFFKKSDDSDKTTENTPVYAIQESLDSKTDADINYALLHDILNYKDNYVNKAVTLTGFYTNSLLQDDGTLAEPDGDEIVYHFITVFDEPGDCYLTTEFVSADDTYPDMQDEITVTGIVQTYKEGNNEYLHLTDSKWSVIKEDTDNAADDSAVSADTEDIEDTAE